MGPKVKKPDDTHLEEQLLGLQAALAEAPSAESAFQAIAALREDLLAVWFFEHGRCFTAPAAAIVKDELAALDESDFLTIEEAAGDSLPVKALDRSTAPAFGPFLAKGRLVPWIVEEIPYAAILVSGEKPAPKGSERFFFTLLAAGLDRRIRGDAAPPVDNNRDLKRKTYEMEVVARTSNDLALVSDEGLFESFLLNIFGVALPGSAALYISRNQQHSDFMLKLAKGVDEMELEPLVPQQNSPLLAALRAGKPVALPIPAEADSIESRLCSEFAFRIALPMIQRNEMSGFLLLGDRINNQPYTESVLQPVGILLGQLAATLETRRLSEIKFAFSRYVAHQLIDEVLANPDALELGGTRRQVTILFADIRNFTTMSENLPPEEVVAILNTFMTTLTEVIFRYEGTIDKYIGDCLMATFGAPLPRPDDAERAIMAAVEMQHAIHLLNNQRRERGEAEIQIGIGLNTGHCISGNMGSVQRMDYTVIGDIVNVAARLEQLARPGQILITAEMLKEIRYLVTADRMPPVKLKGKSRETQIYEVTGLISERVLKHIEQANPKRNAFYRRVWRDAQAVADKLGLSGDELKKFRATLQVYDVGLISLPQDFWRIDGPLPEEAARRLHDHPQFGAELLKKMRFFPEAIDAARHHHEHWDGSGYPKGLQGEAIPLFARIIPVVESFHAMQRQRHYAPTMNRETAWQEITKLSGKYYDPQVVAALEAVLQEQGFAVA